MLPTVYLFCGIYDCHKKLREYSFILFFMQKSTYAANYNPKSSIWKYM